VLRSSESDCDEDGWFRGGDGAVWDEGIGSAGEIGMEVDVDGISGEKYERMEEVEECQMLLVMKVVG